jgi:hypothetical protein
MAGLNTIKLKWLLALALLALGFGLFAVFLLRPARPISTGTLALPDGAHVRIIAATYGTNHIIGTPLARAIAHLPGGLQQAATRFLGGRARTTQFRTTSEPALILWLQNDTPPPTPPTGTGGYIRTVLADASGFVSGSEEDADTQWSNPRALTFYAIPRRDRTIALEFFHHATNGKTTNCGRLVLENPLYGAYPQWTPQPLPATNRVGDVEMVVEQLSTGHNNDTSHHSDYIRFGTNRTDGRNRTVCVCSIRSLSHTNEVWKVANEEVSDATGNRIKNTGMSWGSDSDGYFTFEPSLWTNESAWKLKCELKRSQGFLPEETLAFSQVPLGPPDKTNRIGWMTNLHGATLTLDSLVRRPPLTNDFWSSEQCTQARFTVVVTNGLHADLITTTADTGSNISCVSWSSGGSDRTYSLKDVPRNATNLTFTFAVHRSRWVEFLLQPEVSAARVNRRPHH